MADHFDPFIIPTPAQKKALAEIMAIIRSLPKNEQHDVMLAAVIYDDCGD